MASKQNTFAVLTLVLLACGDTAAGSRPDDADSGAPEDLETQDLALNGRIRMETNERGPTEDLHVAIGWIGGRTRFAVTDDVAFAGDLPGNFILQLSAAPPEDAMLDWFGSRIAIGNVIVYQDTNGDGQTDLPSSFDDESYEPILGLEPTYSIVYLAGEPVTLDGTVIASGYSQVALKSWGEVQYCAEARWPEDTSCVLNLDSDGPTTRSVTTPLELTVSGSLKLPASTCRELDLEPHTGAMTATDLITCHADGSYRVSPSFGPLRDFCWGSLVTSQEVALSSTNVVCARCLAEPTLVHFPAEEYAFDPTTQIHHGAQACQPFDRSALTPFVAVSSDVADASGALAEARSKLRGRWIGRAANPWRPTFLVNLTFSEDGTYRGSSSTLYGTESRPFYYDSEGEGGWQLLALEGSQITGMLETQIHATTIELQLTGLTFDEFAQRAQFAVMNGNYGPIEYDLFRVCEAP